MRKTPCRSGAACTALRAPCCVLPAGEEDKEEGEGEGGLLLSPRPAVLRSHDAARCNNTGSTAQAHSQHRHRHRHRHSTSTGTAQANGKSSHHTHTIRAGVLISFYLPPFAIAIPSNSQSPSPHNRSFSIYPPPPPSTWISLPSSQSSSSPHHPAPPNQPNETH